jgi:hypothetical protein
VDNVQLSGMTNNQVPVRFKGTVTTGKYGKCTMCCGVLFAFHIQQIFHIIKQNAYILTKINHEIYR